MYIPGSNVILVMVYGPDILGVPFFTNAAITIFLFFSRQTYTTLFHHRFCLLDLFLVTIWMVLFIFHLEHTMMISSIKDLEY